MVIISGVPIFRILTVMSAILFHLRYANCDALILSACKSISIMSILFRTYNDEN